MTLDEATKALIAENADFRAALEAGVKAGEITREEAQAQLDSVQKRIEAVKEKALSRLSGKSGKK
jgi:hypothetical protein